MIFTKENYEFAKLTGDADRLRRDEISRRIGLEVPLSEQIEILMDRDTKPEKYARYQGVRSRAIAEVDAIIREWEESE